MSILSNKPRCQFPGPHSGNVHEHQARKFAELDGTAVPNAPTETWLACEAHVPDPADPKFLLCACRLCLERIRTTGGN